MIAKQKPDSEKSERELLLDIVEEEYEHDAAVGKLWGESITFCRRCHEKLRIFLAFDIINDTIITWLRLVNY